MTLAALMLTTIALGAACGEPPPAPEATPTPLPGSPPPPPPAETPNRIGEGSPTPTPDVPPDVALGMQVAQEAGCLGCHSTEPGEVLIGPSWAGLFGSEEQLADGSTVTVDEEYLRQSIRNPRAQIVEGFQDTMPPFPDLTEEEVNGLIAYIRSLQ